MITLYLLAAFFFGSGLGTILGGRMREGKLIDAWNAGHAAGIRDERAAFLAQALWEAEHGSPGCTDPDVEFELDADHHIQRSAAS